MAELEDRYKDNIAGRYFVHEQCLDCELCRETAPDNFKRNHDGGYSYVYKQPENELEEKECNDAMENCPVEAIGDFGDECCGSSCGCH